MMRARVVTPWYIGAGIDERGHPYSERGQGGADCPEVAARYLLESWTDVTGQRPEDIVPEPNAYTVEVVAADVVIEQIEADGYAVVWWEAA